jgi:hypothetical protein
MTIENAGYHRYFRGVICIDIGDWEHYITDPRFDTFLKYIESKKNQFLSILYVETSKEGMTEKIESSISAHTRFDTVRFRFPNADELSTHIEENYFTSKGYSFDAETKTEITELISEVLTCPNFNGFITIEQIAHDLTYYLYHGEIKDKQITIEVWNKYIEKSDYIKKLRVKSTCKKTIGFNTPSTGGKK